MIDGKSLWEQVKANSKRLNECPRHSFDETEVRLGQKLTCKCCGGTMSLTDIGNYIKGFEAAGGFASTVWPAFANSPSRRHQQNERKTGE